MFSGHDITREFEAALSEYTGAPYVVTTTSCTMAILLTCSWCRYRNKHGVSFGAMGGRVSMPKYSYVGVPASILSAGFMPTFSDLDWHGEYQIEPLPVFDSARRFTSNMYRPGYMQCISFHWSKILSLSQGGAILLDDENASEWLRRARFDGRTEGVSAKHDQVTYPSYHAYLSPEVAAHGLMKLATLPKHNADLPRSDYPDLSLIEAFKN